MIPIDSARALRLALSAARGKRGSADVAAFLCWTGRRPASRSLTSRVRAWLAHARHGHTRALCRRVLEELAFGGGEAPEAEAPGAVEGGKAEEGREGG